MAHIEAARRYGRWTPLMTAAWRCLKIFYNSAGPTALLLQHLNQRYSERFNSLFNFYSMAFPIIFDSL